ncbi:uncharacterized protein B0P05DRAFT_562593 [Gilbertella persicaria]|uniref:uncharacterized protein n=1 Tax=Gilbertella persicaria TaxID=101096 RepID=UPI00221F2290|nr:uncharacterized protein B0P05DRAFT_562593 [Gilbertella persicaria]KAI8051397.1 hypothetical protein B0P05DRAFT_562593 [Gilbertella persicaria]
MISPLFVCVSYGVWIFLIPFLLYSSYIGDILSQLAYFFHVDFYVSKLEPVVLCLGLITFYCFVLMGFVFDLIRSLRRQNDVSHLNAAFLFRFEKAYAELRQLFPPFVVSCGLLYVNTTRFDTLRNR